MGSHRRRAAAGRRLGEIVEQSGRLAIKAVGVFGALVIYPPTTASVADSFVAFNQWSWNQIEPVMSVRAFGIRPAAASRDGRSDGAHALLPADIFSSTVQLVARLVCFRDSLAVARAPVAPAAARRYAFSYSSWRRNQLRGASSVRVSFRPRGARSSHWYMPQRPSTPRAYAE
jgi:hypothetical protein